MLRNPTCTSTFNLWFVLKGMRCMPNLKLCKVLHNLPTAEDPRRNESKGASLSALVAIELATLPLCRSAVSIDTVDPGSACTWPRS